MDSSGGDGGASGGESVGASEAPTSTTPASTTPAADAPAEAPVVEESVPEPAEPAVVAPAPVEPARDEKPERKQSRQDNRSLLKKALAALQFRKQARLGKVEALAKQKGSITNDDVQLALRVSHATATRYLTELAQQERLKMVGHPKNARYEPS